MATYKIQTGIRFEETTLRKIAYIAKKNKRSTTAQVEYLAQQCIDAYEKEHGKNRTTGKQVTEVAAWPNPF